MTEQTIFARRLEAVVTPDGKTAGIVGWDNAGNQLALTMEPNDMAGLIVDLLHAFYKAPGFVSTVDGTTTGPVDTVPMNQHTLALGENGQPLLSVAVGAIRLTFQFGSSADLRRHGTAALELATIVDRHGPGRRQ